MKCATAAKEPQPWKRLRLFYCFAQAFRQPACFGGWLADRRFLLLLLGLFAAALRPAFHKPPRGRVAGAGDGLQAGVHTSFTCLSFGCNIGVFQSNNPAFTSLSFG
jgi:hypothetical protein